MYVCFSLHLHLRFFSLIFQEQTPSVAQQTCLAGLIETLKGAESFKGWKEACLIGFSKTRKLLEVLNKYNPKPKFEQLGIALG